MKGGRYVKITSALSLAAQGFRVFPISPNSKIPPADFHWKEEATTDPAKVETWWTDNPDYNIGLATGHGLLVVDADTKDGRPGLASLDMLDMMGQPESLRVATPSGGTHVYLRTTHKHRNRVDTVPNLPGIDIRSDGGYVLAPGSTIDGVPYASVSGGVSVEAAPAWLDELLLADTPRNTPKSDAPLVELDRPDNLAKAKHYLTNNAPDAVEGAGGDASTYRVAARLRDFGLSEDAALEHMLEHWNETKASPPWQPDDLATKVKNAFNHATGGWGAGTAAGEFDVLDLDVGLSPIREIGITDEKKPPSPFPLTRAAEVKDSHTPPRQWLYGYMLSRKYVGILASPGGVGKTAYTFGAAIAMASGQPLLHDAPHKPLNVWLYNLEDDLLELQRRVQAAARHYDADQETLSRIHLTSGRDRPLQIVTQKDGKTVATTDAQALADALIANKIDVLVLDPLVNAHAIPENDNEAAAKLMKVVAKIADQANCAIWLVHHTRKGFVSGEADSIRGGSPLVANSRGAHTLAPMSTEEAEVFGVPEDMRKRYIKLDDAKANMSVSSGKARWMHLQSVSLGNGDADYPTGDSVQVVTRWSPPQALDGLEHSDIRAMLVAIEAGTADGERFSMRSQDKDRWAGNLLVNEFDRTAEQAKSFLKTAEQKGWIVTEEYSSPTQRKTRKGIVVYLANVPENEVSDLD